MNAIPAALILSFAASLPPQSLGASPIPPVHRTVDQPLLPGEQPAVWIHSSSSKRPGQYRVPGPSPRSTFLPNQVIVKLNPGRTLADISHLIAKYNVTPIRRLAPTPQLLGGQPDGDVGHLQPQGVVNSQLLLRLQRRSLRAPARLEPLHMHNIYLLGLPAEAHLLPLLHDCQIDPAIQYAEPDYLPESSTLPDDTYIDPDQNGDWSYGSWGQDFNDMWGLEAIQAHMAWDISQGDNEIIIAIVDTGVDYSHEDIAANIWTNGLELNGVGGVDDDLNGYVDDVRGWNFSSSNNDVTDSYGHGTHVAGIAAAIGNNARGIAGVTWYSKVMCLKATSSSSYAEAIRYAADNGADIINMSWRLSVQSAVIVDAIRYAYYGDGPYTGGVILVAAAGNDEADAAAYCPANLKETITISAANHEGLLAGFSNFGSAIDVAGPGTDILSLSS
ncbi:MAG: S8 family serine peptidase [Planctomycetota bacterium]|nr:MAG: S8 family serine peptidase [Planctomycetota bacterium]